MTITTTTLRAQYNGNGVTTSFAVPFEFLEGSTLKVILTDEDGVDTTQTITTHYTVTGGGTVQPDDGSVVMVTAPATGEKLTILRAQPLTQAASYTEQGPFPAKAHEKALDRLDMQVQMVSERTSRALKLKETSTNSDLVFPEPAADKIVGWNAAGTALENKDGLDASVDAAAASAAAALVSQNAASASATAAQTAETNAETAETNAETAETNAETAQAAAEVAQAAAEAAAASINPALFVEIADTDASGFGFVVDEDNMASDSATKVPTQQSVKAYVDANATNGAPIVILSTGQSNAALHPTYSWTPEPNVFLWDFDGIVDDADTDVGSAFAAMDATSMGFDYAYANEIAKAHPASNVYLVKIGEGGQAIAQWKVGAAAPDMYDACKDNIEAALTLLGLDTIDHFLWWQGETDASAGSVTYLADFETVIARFRAETWFPYSTPITIMGFSITFSTPVTNFNGYLAAAAAVEPDIRKYVHTGVLPSAYWDPAVGSLNVHMTAAGYEQAGKLAYGGLAAVLKGFYIDPASAEAKLIAANASQLRSYVENTNSVGLAGFAAKSSQGTLQLVGFGTAVGIPGGAQFSWTGAGPFYVGATDAAGLIIFQSGGTGERARFETSGNFLAQNAIRSVHATSGVGYATGAGGAVTQATSKATGVTLNKVCGQITTHNASLAAGAEVSFTVTNSAVAATDIVGICIASGATAGGYNVQVDAVAAGSFRVSISNLSAGALAEALVLNFAVIKGVAA